MELGDGRVDVESLLNSAKAGSKLLVAADFGRIAESVGSVISASLFGAFAGAGVLPIPRENYEETIRLSGKGVDRSLAAFDLGFIAAQEAAAEAEAEKSRPAPPSGLGPVRVTIGKRPPQDPEAEAAEAEAKRHHELAISNPRSLVGPELASRMDRVEQFPEAARSMVIYGCVKTAVYQSLKYTDLYLDRAERFIEFDRQRNDETAELSLEVARHIALWMAYQDTIQVALQKVRARRLEGVRKEAKATEGQLTQVREYLHPQLDEIADTLPTALGRWLSNSKLMEKIVGKVTRNGMIVNTTSIFGFGMLRLLSSMRPIRPRSLRYGREQEAIEAWLDLAVDVAASDYDLSCEIVKAARVLKGYGATHSHGKESFEKLMNVVPSLRGQDDAAKTLDRLIKAALKDEDGVALDQALAGLALTSAR
jgi:indolepyruvate ferredoxin oxidoreductase beta subunit